MRILEIIRLGIRNIFLHKLRSTLTVLGIIFGVAAVISMLSIGEGARYEALQQIKLMGVQNITVRSVKPPQAARLTEVDSGSISYGLTRADAEAIAQIAPVVEQVVPIKEVRKDVWFEDRRTQARVVGTTPEYRDILSFDVSEGMGRFISALDNERCARVCVVGDEIRRDLFGYRHPLGRDIRVGDQHFCVVGVMEDKSAAGKAGVAGMHNLNRDIYIPYETARLRFGDFAVTATASQFEAEQVEIDELICRVRSEEIIPWAATAIKRSLERRHQRREPDYEVVVPQELLRQQQRTSRMFNIVMGSIASISLLVGGIGIMNIMLASVVERTEEIGIRRALGARRVDIVRQFLTETVVLSVAGGVVGIVLGVVGARVVTYLAEWRTIVSVLTILIAFGISAFVGIAFGMYPASKAARMDPIASLRYE